MLTSDANLDKRPKNLTISSTKAACWQFLFSTGVESDQRRAAIDGIPAFCRN
ncbi:hypothetical protein [Tahibacter aquaticus]|uniref:hypothetical protein n=1 Tax=Tahibacter aquaticus TaxID=520092 RepID=UPI001414F9BD|nr:hypothetical protein [Tahibacter aquaticus]